MAEPRRRRSRRRPIAPTAWKRPDLLVDLVWLIVLTWQILVAHEDAALAMILVRAAYCLATLASDDLDGPRRR